MNRGRSQIFEQKRKCKQQSILSFDKHDELFNSVFSKNSDPASPKLSPPTAFA